MGPAATIFFADDAEAVPKKCRVLTFLARFVGVVNVWGMLWARKALTDLRQALPFLAQGPEHPVRQHEPLDVCLLSDLSDHRRRHAAAAQTR